ncbi:hypothetical protein EB796_003473 [Bugula neritina]|uniref:Uncharacterized protein n=1 Tax=Bugula neritina TaxID=10212 RepID=A0A7J7KHQ4_BUGNE|nr:hypothetical protein EB796_003473 [Bugula neritina]
MVTNTCCNCRKKNGVSRNNSSKVPKHLVSNDSFRSIYDNHPISENSDLPVPPIDYDLDRSYRRKPTVAARHRSESSSSNRLSAQSAASVRSDHLDTADTTPTSSQLPFVESATFRQQSSDSAVSAELDIAVLKLDLSEEEEEVIKPDLPPRNKITDSFFEAELEKTLDEPARSSRSASKSPDIETANSSSHMYVRSAGFRGRTLSPPGARNKTQTTDIQLSPTQTSEGLNSKPEIPKPSPRPSNIPLKSSANYGRPSADYGRASAGYERGDVEIPITHLPAGKVPRSNGSIPVPTRLNQSPVSPVNSSSGGTRSGSRKTPPSKSPRPFPVPRSNIPVMQSSSARSNTTPVSSGLHLVSPTKPAVSPQYIRPFAISPHYARPSLSSQPTSPQYGKQVFHTFGGRGRQNHRTPSPSVTSSATQGRRSVDNLASGADGIRSPPVSSLRSPRYISVTPRPQLPLSAGNRTFYVVADPSNSRQLPNKTPSRYDFNEDDKSTQKPVFL